MRSEAIGMAKAVKCPVCNENGKVCYPPEAVATAGPTYVVCHGCGGRGWVEVSGD